METLIGSQTVGVTIRTTSRSVCGMAAIVVSALAGCKTLTGPNHLIAIALLVVSIVDQKKLLTSAKVSERSE